MVRDLILTISRINKMDGKQYATEYGGIAYMNIDRNELTVKRVGYQEWTFPTNELFDIYVNIRTEPYDDDIDPSAPKVDG